MKTITMITGMHSSAFLKKKEGSSILAKCHTKANSRLKREEREEDGATLIARKKKKKIGGTNSRNEVDLRDGKA